MKLHKVCQKDIADALGVSCNTVSHALRDMDDISIALKEKVREKAMELGYIPNTLASKLRSGSTKTLALIYDNMTNPYFTLMAEKLIRLVKTHGYDTIIIPSWHYEVLYDTFLEILELQVDGILSFVDFEQSILNSPLAHSLPIVLVGRLSKGDIPCVHIDDFLGGKLVGDYFNQNGLKKVAYISQHTIENSSRRYKGLLSTFQGEIVLYVDMEEKLKKHCKFTTEFLKNEGIEGIFCFNDTIANQIINCNSGHLDNIKIVGFDNIHKELNFFNELTSVDFDFDAVAEKATNLILDIISQKEIINKNTKISVQLHLKGE